MNKKILIPLAMILTTLLLCVPVLARRADTVVIGGGWIIDEDDHRANFAFNVDSDLNGRVQYSVHGIWHMSSTGIDSFRHRSSLEPTWVEITGTCTVKDLSTGLTYDDVFFQLEVVDNGEPGGMDHPEGNPGDWIIVYVGEDYISMEGDEDPTTDPTGQHIDGGNIQHKGLEGPYPPLP